MSMRHFFYFLVVVCLLCPFSIPVDANGLTTGQTEELKKKHYENAASSWSNFTNSLIKNGKAEPSPTLGVRSLADQALMAGMAVKHYQDARQPLPESLANSLAHMAPVLELAEQMQDVNSESKTFGNFRWYWRTTEVTDQNAVEFFVSHAFPLWAEARDVISSDAKVVLERLLRRSTDGCIRHTVKPDYTNITLFNIVHNIVLGETFERPDAVAEGRKRLAMFLNVLYDHGAFEYVSPTYYAVDIDALQFGYRYISDPEIRETFKILLDYFWTDMALNWYLQGQRLSGAQSRTYDYLRGLGGVDMACGMAGLATAPTGKEGVRLQDGLLGTYAPTPKTLALASVYPRLIEQRWGEETGQWRTTHVTRNMALGTAGASYGSMQDMTLTVDLADFNAIPDKRPDVFLPRNYFIADGREDPYGTNRYPTSTAGHMKALHMNPYWAAVQNGGDAIGVVFYPPKSILTNVHTNIQSHFVCRIPDAVFVAGRSVLLTSDTTNPVVIDVGNKPVVLQYGSRVIGLRVLWGINQTGATSAVRLVNDHNKNGVWRLTIEQWDKTATPVETPLAPPTNSRVSVTSSEGLDPYVPKEATLNPDTMSHIPGAVMWVRIGEGISDAAELQSWATNFAKASVSACSVDSTGYHVSITGKEGPLELKGNSPLETTRSVSYTPAPSPGLLRCNGQEYGKNLLAKVPQLADHQRRLDAVKPIVVHAEPVVWEAEQGYIAPELIERIDGASKGRAVRINGACWWTFDVKTQGTYYLWARHIVNDNEHDSVFVEWYRYDSNGTKALVRRDDWHLGKARSGEPRWLWEHQSAGNKKERVSVELSPGRWSLLVKPREFDAMFDQFYLTTDPKQTPQIGN